MIHTKTIDPWDTAKYDPFCKLYWNNSWKEKCQLGFPFPHNNALGENETDVEGFEYNCYKNKKLENKWAPKLHKAMKERVKRT